MNKSEENETVKLAASVFGKRGGTKTKKLHGHDFYVKIGKLGGRAKNKKRNNENNTTQSGSKKIKN